MSSLHKRVRTRPGKEEEQNKWERLVVPKTIMNVSEYNAKHTIQSKMKKDYKHIPKPGKKKSQTNNNITRIQKQRRRKENIPGIRNQEANKKRGRKENSGKEEKRCKRKVRARIRSNSNTRKDNETWTIALTNPLTINCRIWGIKYRQNKKQGNNQEHSPWERERTVKIQAQNGSQEKKRKTRPSVQEKRRIQTNTQTKMIRMKTDTRYLSRRMWTKWHYIEWAVKTHIKHREKKYREYKIYKKIKTTRTQQNKQQSTTNEAGRQKRKEHQMGIYKNPTHVQISLEKGFNRVYTNTTKHIYTTTMDLGSYRSGSPSRSIYGANKTHSNEYTTQTTR